MGDAEQTITVEVTKEHAWLQQLVGEWTTEGDAAMGPDQPRQKFGGKESTRAFGEVWVIANGESAMPEGGVGYTIATYGYDTAKKKFVGSFIGTMMTNQWIYEGTLDESGCRLTLDCEGPSFTGDGTIAPYRDVIEFTEDGKRTLTSYSQSPDGEWTEFMTLRYTRVG